MPDEIPTLRAKTQELTEAAFRLLSSSLAKGERIPQRTVEVHKITGPGAWSKDYEARPEYYIFVDRHRKEIEALPEFGDWMHAMRADPTITKHFESLVGTSHGSIGRSAWEYFVHLLLKQLSSSGDKCEFDAETFDQSYRRLKRFFYRDVVEFRAFSPLQNFSTDVDVIDLSGKLRIRKIIDRELEELLDASSYGSVIPFGEIPSYRYAMELEYETEKIFGEMKIEDIKPIPDQVLFGKLLTGLRMFKPGTVGFNFIKTIPAADSPGVFAGTRFGLEYRRYWGSGYALTGPEVEAFKDFWKSFSEIDLEQRAQVGIAISRFNYAYERQGLEDKLIDYMIAFEALFFKTGEWGEYRHKLGVRVARLLAKEYDDRKAIAKEMMEFYDARSKVVHGEKTSLKSGFVEKVEQYLRESIMHFIRLAQTTDYDEIISRLDLE